MNMRYALAAPLALAALSSFAAPAALAAPGPSPASHGGLVLGIGKDKGKLHLGAAVHFGPSHGRRAMPHGPFVSIHAHPPQPRRIWIPARTETVHERVYVPGAQRQVWVPARYETCMDYLGRPVRVLVSPGHYRTVQEPGRWQVVARSVHHPGHWGWRH